MQNDEGSTYLPDNFNLSLFYVFSFFIPFCGERTFNTV